MKNLTIHSSDLDRKLRIETNTGPESNYGDPTYNWETFATVWAKRIDTGGMESLKADQIRATEKSTFIIWYISGITEKHRVYDIDEDQYFNIVSKQLIGRRNGIKLICDRTDGNQ